jgi:hypothetical protein
MESYRRICVAQALCTFLYLGCSGTPQSIDGQSGGSIGTGGAVGSGGAANTGGRQSTSTGGANAIGGSANTGGKQSTSTGGANAIGGNANTGGKQSTSTGGAISTGGANAIGGSVGTGGSKTTGGSSSSGGTAATGGKATGGVAPTGGSNAAGGATGGTTSSNTGGGNATIPALPKHVLIGWGAGNYNDTWAKNSGTKYDVQWTYLSGQAGNNWYNDYGYGAADGSMLNDILSTIDSYGFIPGIHLYNMGYGHDQGDAGLLTEIQNATWTKQYFTEFKVMMQKIKNFGKPVIIVLEGDSFGMVEMLTSNKPNTAAAVASTGLPELAGLPNTVAGFGMAFLAMRKSVGVPNVAMGPDTPYYAANGDIMNYPPADTDALQAHVDFQWSFFGPLGVGTNQTGDRFDFSASCPRAADQDAYSDGRDKWSNSDTASVNSPSISRYIEWLRLYNQTSGVPWVLHQVPIGNSQHLNTAYSANTARSGYRDILVEYLFQYESPASTALRTTHVGNFAHAGVAAFLFGFSDDGDMPTNDLWKDNQPFFNTHVASFIQAGGYPL